MSTAEDKKALQYWIEYEQNLQRATIVDASETEVQKLARIDRLKNNHEEAFAYYFPNYCYAQPAPFHIESSNRIMNLPEWYEVRAWSRELAKSARTMMEIIMLALWKKKRSVLMISSSGEAATRLLKPFKINFEKNQRIINDFGKQQTWGEWKEDSFIIAQGCSFLAIGAGQSPRGSRNEEVRPDVILMDDFDTDEDCRNPDTIEKKWDWFEQAVYATRSISNPMLVIFCGNIIGEVCCIKNAIKKADKHTIVNIRDKNGKSTWPNKNTEELIDRVLSKISWAAQQKEYFNTPITLGKVFKKINYGKMRPLREYKFMVLYTDPSYKKNGDTKASALIGKWKQEYHVVKMRCGHVTTAEMLDWNYEIMKYVDGQVPVLIFIEWPWIDDQLKAEIKAANKRHKITIHPKADERDKPDKYFRMESALEPINRAGLLIFNEEDKDSDHMTITEGQFLALSPNSRAHDDAPDAVEGGKWILDNKSLNNSSEIQTVNRSRGGSKKY